MYYGLHVRLWYEKFVDIYPEELNICSGGGFLGNRHTSTD